MKSPSAPKEPLKMLVTVKYPGATILVIGGANPGPVRTTLDPVSPGVDVHGAGHSRPPYRLLPDGKKPLGSLRGLIALRRGYIVIVGPAGSGKSTLTKFLVELANERGPKAIAVNLDPAVEETPYDPHVDVRNYVTVSEFMKKGLGPNGALIASVASLANFVRDLEEDIEEYKPDLVFIDTPGQLELFAYRSSGPIILRTLIGNNPAMTLFLMDAPFFEDPLSIVSALSLASSVAVRMGLPQVNTATKADLLLPEILEEVIPRLLEEGYLEGLVEDSRGVDYNIRLLAVSLAQAIRLSGFIGEVIPVTIYREDMVSNVYAKILQILFSGEEPGYERFEEELEDKEETGESTRRGGWPSA